MLFTLLAERYERRSVLITSNLVFSKWDSDLQGPDDDGRRHRSRRPSLRRPRAAHRELPSPGRQGKAPEDRRDGSTLIRAQAMKKGEEPAKTQKEWRESTKRIETMGPRC